MGYDAYAYGVLGVRITEADLVDKVKVPHNEHEVPEKSKFCPECGKPAFSEKEVFKLTGKVMEESAYYHLEKLVEKLGKGFRVVSTNCEDGSDWFAGLAAQGNCRIDIEKLDIADVKAKLKSVFGEHFPESDFGLWIVKHESY